MGINSKNRNTKNKQREYNNTKKNCTEMYMNKIDVIS